jgi:hypothetical protein
MQVVMLHKEFAQKLTETVHFAEYRAARMWAAGRFFVQIAQIPT